MDLFGNFIRLVSAIGVITGYGDTETDDAARAETIRQEYADGTEGLTTDEVNQSDLEFTEEQAETLVHVLGSGGDGRITDEEQIQLDDAGFSHDFIDSLAGDNGARALQQRARWLGDHVVTRWSRIDYSAADRRDMIVELGGMGVYAEGTLSNLIEVAREDSEIRRLLREGNFVDTAIERIGVANDEVVAYLLEQRSQSHFPSHSENLLIDLARQTRARGDELPDALQEALREIAGGDREDEISLRTRAHALAVLENQPEPDLDSPIEDESRLLTLPLQRYERVALEGDPDRGTLFHIRMLHSTTGADEDPGLILRVGSHQAHILAELRDQNISDIFLEGHVEGYDPFRGNGEEQVQRIQQAFSNLQEFDPNNLTVEQFTLLYTCESYFIYQVLRDSVTIHPTTTREEHNPILNEIDHLRNRRRELRDELRVLLQSRDHAEGDPEIEGLAAEIERLNAEIQQITFDKREEIESRPAVDFMRSNPEARTAFIYGAAHEFVDDFQRIGLESRVVEVDWRPANSV